LYWILFDEIGLLAIIGVIVESKGRGFCDSLLGWATWIEISFLPLRWVVDFCQK